MEDDARDHAASSTVATVLQDLPRQSASAASSRRASLSAKLFSRVFSNRVKPAAGAGGSPSPPPEVVSLVEEYLHRARAEAKGARGEEQKEVDDGELLTESRDLLVTTWDFGGRESLMGTQHLFMSDEV